MKKVLFVTAGSIEWASSRMRAHWPAHYIEGAEVVQHGEHQGIDAEAVVFQKLFDVEYAKETRRLGRKVFWDVCDPAWWWQPKECAEILRHVNGVVCSSEALRKDFAAWCGDGTWSHTIVDRLDLSHFPKQREHCEANPLRFIWFGAGQNRVALFGALATLERLAANGVQIELTVMDDQPEADWHLTQMFPVYAIRWSLDRENEILAAHDVAVLPPYPGPWGQVKSNNKSLTAWACGLPVTSGMDYAQLARLTDVARRVEGARLGRIIVEENYQVEQSAREWEKLL